MTGEPSSDGTPGLADELFEVAFAGAWDAEAKVRWRGDVARADSMGMREGVFAKVGDSNLSAYNALYGLGFLDPVWGGYEWLEPTMRRYREVGLPPGDNPGGQAEPVRSGPEANSFNRFSAATRSMIVGRNLIEPVARFSDGFMGWFPDSDNDPAESMLQCEMRILKPRFAFLNIGANGQSYGFDSQETAGHVGEVIDEIKRLGPVPVVLTTPPRMDPEGKKEKWEFARETAEAIAEVARAAGVPVFDQWSALSDERLTFHGLVEYDQGYFDGLHLETRGGFSGPNVLQKSVDFSQAALLYGINLRNLLLLMTLKTLDEALSQ